MTELFGVDFPTVVNEALGGGLRPAALVKSVATTRDPDNLSGGLRPTEKRYPCRGVRLQYKASQFDGELIKRGDVRVLLLAGSLPLNIVPVAADFVEIEGRRYRIMDVTTDPGGATHACQSRGL